MLWAHNIICCCELCVWGLQFGSQQLIIVVKKWGRWKYSFIPCSFSSYFFLSGPILVRTIDSIILHSALYAIHSALKDYIIMYNNTLHMDVWAWTHEKSKRERKREGHTFLITHKPQNEFISFSVFWFPFDWPRKKINIMHIRS